MISFGKVDVSTIRKQKLIQYLKQAEKNSDSLSFISMYIKCTIDQKKINKLRGILEDQEYNNLIKTTQYAKTSQPEEYAQYSDYTSVPIIIVLEGSITLEYIKQSDILPQNVLSCKKNDLLILDDEYILENKLKFEDFSDAKFTITSTQADTEFIYFDRKLWNTLMKNSEDSETDQKHQILQKCFPEIKKAEKRAAMQYCKYFKSQKQKAGCVLTTNTSGSQDLFVVQSGKALIFTPSKKINENYQIPFIIIQILEAKSIFNEAHVLFDKEQTYSTLIIEDDTQLLHIDKHNLQVVSDQESTQQFRANYQAKDRLQKQIIKKLSTLSNEQLLQQQETYCQKYNTSFKNIEQYIKNSTDKKGKVVTHSFLKEREKNIKAFETKMKASEQLDLKKQNGVLMTPRIVSKDGKFKGLDSQAQLSLLALRSMGVSNRQNKCVNPTNKIDEKVLEQQKKELMEDKQDVLLERKPIKKNNFVESPDKAKTQKKRLSISEDEALQKIGILRKQQQEQKNTLDNHMQQQNQQQQSQQQEQQQSQQQLFIINKKPQETLNINKKEDKFAATRKRIMKLGI